MSAYTPDEIEELNISRKGLQSAIKHSPGCSIAHAIETLNRWMLQLQECQFYLIPRHKIYSQGGYMINCMTCPFKGKGAEQYPCTQCHHNIEKVLGAILPEPCKRVRPTNVHEALIELRNQNVFCKMTKEEVDRILHLCLLGANGILSSKEEKEGYDLAVSILERTTG